MSRICIMLKIGFMKRLALYFLVALGFFSCSSDKSEYLPRANGNPGDIVLIMDSVQWNGDLGREVRKVFADDVAGLPQPEPMFDVIAIHPSRDVTMLTRMRNLVYVFTLDQQTSGSKILRREFSEETLKRIKTDTTFYLSTGKDEFSRGQDVMYLFGTTEQALIRNLRRQKQNIIDFFNKSERQRLSAEMLNVSSTKGITAFLPKDQQCDIQLPVGFRLADKQSDFVWFRYITAEIDKDLFISWKPYESEYQLLPDSIVAWRNEICKKYIYEDPENPASYLVTEQHYADIQARQMKLNNNFAMEVRGLWRTNTPGMGGPFLGYALIDEARARLYYIEGFVYAPGKEKREMMRELEVALWSFKTSKEIKKAASE